jgi:hypothetical protein
MSALTLRLPDHKHTHLKALTESDAETHFLARVERGLALLRKAQSGIPAADGSVTSPTAP